MTVQSISLTIWLPTENEARRVRQIAQTVNSHKKPGEKRATLIEVPK